MNIDSIVEPEVTELASATRAFGASLDASVEHALFGRAHTAEDAKVIRATALRSLIRALQEELARCTN